MKKNISKLFLLGGIAILFAGGMILSSCEGPMGPMGPSGADGTDGIDGVDGTDGTDGVAGNAVCMECHTLEVKDAVTELWAASLHGTSQTFYPGSPTTVEYAGARYDCAMCHSAEGFIETVWTGMDTTAYDIAIPTGIRCKACHEFHSSLDFENEANSAIRQTMAVTLMADETVTVEFTNTESNLCLTCHQSRSNPADDTDGTAIVEVTSHYGPHHGPQANFINGYGGYEFRGEVTPSSGVGNHDCISCHMGDVVGDTIGGHTFTASLDGCVTCHATIETDVEEVHDLLVELQGELLLAGMVDADGHAIEGVSYEADSVGALWNYLFLEEEASTGVHNIDYAVDLLTASIAFISSTK